MTVRLLIEILEGFEQEYGEDCEIELEPSGLDPVIHPGDIYYNENENVIIITH